MAICNIPEQHLPEGDFSLVMGSCKWSVPGKRHLDSRLSQFTGMRFHWSDSDVTVLNYRRVNRPHDHKPWNASSQGPKCEVNLCLDTAVWLWKYVLFLAIRLEKMVEIPTSHHTICLNIVISQLYLPCFTYRMVPPVISLAYKLSGVTT